MPRYLPLPPSELDRQDWDTIQLHIAILNLEAEPEALKQKHAAKSS